MTLLSNPGLSLGGGGMRPWALSSERNAAASAALSARSFAALNRRVRCWFIFARGAGPSMAINSSFRGRTTAADGPPAARTGG